MKTDMNKEMSKVMNGWTELQQIAKWFRTDDLSIERKGFFGRNTFSWICTKQMFTIDRRYPPEVVHNFSVDNVDNFVNN